MTAKYSSSLLGDTTSVNPHATSVLLEIISTEPRQSEQEIGGTSAVEQHQHEH